MGIKHTFTSAIPDTNDPTKVRPSNWNDDHTIDGDVDFNGHAIVNADLPDAGAGEFTELADVPSTYSGAGNKLVAVNSGATGLTFIEPSAGGPVDEFTDLLDVPGSFSGQAGKVATVNAGETALEFTAGGNDIGWVTPQQYGAVANGTAYQLSAFYGSLAEAQAAYNGAFYFATSLSQTIDYVASKAAANECFGPDLERGAFIENMVLDVSGTTVTLDGVSFVDNELVGKTLFGQFISNDFIVSSPIVSNTSDTVTTETALGIGTSSRYVIGYGEHGNLAHLNKVLYFPGGTYRFGNDTLTIRNLRSGIIRGAGRLVTELTGSGIVLQFDGIWYSTIKDFSILSSGGGAAALDIDGNVPGHDYNTRGIQGLVLESLLIDAAGGPIAFAFARQGGSSAQGDQCLYLNLHLSNTTFACYSQIGFNSLNNAFISGNFQTYTKHAIYTVGGTFGVFNTAFQSTTGYTQMLNEGSDIHCGNTGAFEGCPIYGCRTESWSFLNNVGAVTCDVRAVGCQPSAQGWSATTGYGPNHSTHTRRAIFVQTQADLVAGTNINRIFVPDTDGSSGLVEPTWPIDGTPTATDGDIIWTEDRTSYSVYNGLGSVSWSNCYGPNFGKKFSQGDHEVELIDNLVDHHVESGVDIMSVDSTDGPLTLWLPDDYGSKKIVLVRKVSADSNVIELRSAVRNFAGIYDGGPDFHLTFSDPFGWLVLLSGITQIGGGQDCWAIIGQSHSRAIDYTIAATATPSTLRITEGLSAAPVVVSSEGNAADIDLTLAPKGAGVVRVGTHSAIAAETVTGYITIKDSGGTVRKLAVVS